MLAPRRSTRSAVPIHPDISSTFHLLAGIDSSARTLEPLEISA
jgi:hypothetical protein